MTNQQTERACSAHAFAPEKGRVVLEIQQVGVQAESWVMSTDAARELAEELLKASGIKFTLKF